MPTCPAIRGIAFILALLDEDGSFLEREPGIPEFNKHGNQPGFYLTGQVVAACIQVRLTPQHFGRLASEHF